MAKSKAAIPDFKPKLAPRPKRKPEPPQGPVRMALGIKHTINGNVFGPGVVDVPAEYVAAIQENESANAREERKLREPRAALIGRGCRVIDVPADFFDNPESLPVAF